MKTTITITKNDAGQRLDKFLTKTYRNLPMPLLYKAIRKKDIRLNDKRCEASDRLKEGDVLRLFLPDDGLLYRLPNGISDEALEGLGYAVHADEGMGWSFVQTGKEAYYTDA